MPIRFRCGHCNQLMGIARRKAGTSVRCPTCQTPVLVPQPEEEASPPLPAKPPAEAPAPLFERSDFEAFLDNPQPQKPHVAEPAAAALPPPSLMFAPEQPSSPSVSLTAGAAASRSAGLILSPSQATWLTVAVILLVALAFGTGLLIGYYWLK